MRADGSLLDLDAVGASPAALLVVNEDDVVLTASSGATRLLGRPDERFDGTRLGELLGIEPNAGVLERDDPFVVIRRDRVALALRAQTIVVDQGAATRLIVLRDVSDEQRQLGDLSFRADHEPTTRLPNRAAAVHVLGDLLRHRVAAGIVAVELDRLAQLLPLLGDELIGALVSVAARRIEQLGRPGDHLAHIGPAQLVLVRPGLGDDEDLLDLAVGIADAIGTSLDLGTSTFLTAPRCGATLAPPEASADTAMREALVAMRRAVEAQLDVERFTPALLESERRHLQIERALHGALSAEGLDFHLQPIVDVATGRVAAYESLARWTHPELGRIGPDEFIPLAERVGLIRQIGECGVESALSMIDQFRTAGVVPRPIAVNLSPSQLLDAAFIRFLTDAVAERDAEGMLAVEVTESILASPGAVDTLHELARRGISISIDDFGTGFSALSYLAALPARVVKIDRSFVLRLAEERTRIVVKAIIGLAHALGLRVVAEGIESQAVLDDLARLGCDAVQGYWTGAPAPIDRWLEKDTPEPVVDRSPAGRRGNATSEGTVGT